MAIEEILECSVCSEILNEPVTLICQHTFCRLCLESDIKTCPLCRAKIWLPPRKVINSTLKETIIDLFGNEKYQEIYEERKKNLMKNDLIDQVTEELREELWRSVSDNIPDGKFIEAESEIKIDEDDEDDSLLNISHSTYWIIIIILIALIVLLN